MEKEYYDALVRIRLERAKELLDDAEGMLKKESYKSANNRAYYAIEKALKGLLAAEQMEVATHNGVLKQFNYLFIYKGDGTFDSEDYKKVAKAEQIRNASDYDDFYVTSKSEAKQQVQNAVYLVRKIEMYLNKQNR